MIRVLVADDHPVVRGGVKQMLVDSLPGAFIGEAQSVQEVLVQIQTKHWDTVILDITMPGESGLEALRKLKVLAPALPVIILSVYPEDQFAVRAIRAGAAAYLSKKSLAEELIGAVKTVLAGHKYISEAVADLLMAHVQQTQGEEPAHTRLSDREFHVFRLLVEGKTITEIADTLSLSLKTVSTYRSRILDKLNVRTNADLIRYAFHHHIE